MGRILEALRRGDGPRQHVESVVIPRAYQPTVEAPAEAQDGEDIPFIEVGGPRTVSTSVPRPGPTVPAPESVRPSQESEPTTGSEPLPVVFQPLAEDRDGIAVAERLAAELVAFHQPEHPVSAQYRELLAALTAQVPADRPQVVLFTTARSGVGATNVLLNLAITCALRGEARVAVVDANVRRPAIAHRLGLPAIPGLQDVLAGHASLPRALQETGVERLQALAAGDEAPDGPVRLAGESMRSLLRQLGQRFDWIFVDGPCWDGRPEVVGLGTACDAVCLVLPQSDSASPEVASLLRVIPEQGAPLRGCVLVQR